MRIPIPDDLPSDPREAYRAGFREGMKGLAKRAGGAGGKARAKSMTPERRREIAKMGAEKRWNKK